MHKEVLRLAIPNIISNLAIPLLSAVDTALMGHQPKAVLYVGALVGGTAIFNLLYWGIGFLRMGITGITAQAYGRAAQKDITAVFYRGVLVAVVLAGTILLLQSPFLDLGLGLFGGDTLREELISSYYKIRVWAAPATLFLLVTKGWLLGMQNAKLAMWLSILVNLINILASVFFVFWLKWDIDGVAWGTVLAQYAGLCLAIILLSSRYPFLKQKPKWSRIFEAAGFKHFFTVNLNIFLRTICLVFTFQFFLVQSRVMGELHLAGNGLLLSLLTLMSYFTDGVAFASESIVGKYIASSQKQKVKKAIKVSFTWASVAGFLFSMSYLLAGSWILKWFTDESEIVVFAGQYLFWMIIIAPLGAWAFLWDGVYTGATATAAMRNSMAIATILGFLPAYFILKPLWGNHALWFAMTVFMFLRAFVLSLYAPKRIFSRI